MQAALVAALSIAILACFGYMLLAGLFASGNPGLSRRIMTEINRAVGTDSTRFTADRVRGTVLHGAVVENPRLLVRTSSGEITWAGARTLRVDYDLMGLLFGRARDLKVVIDSPRIDLVHDRNGEIVVPRFAHRQRGTPSVRQTQVEIAVRGGGLSIDRAEIEYGGIDGHATLRVGGGRSELLIRDLEGSSQNPNRPGRLEMSGTILADGDALQAAPLEIALGKSRVTARVGWDLAAGRVRSGLLSLHPLHVEELSRTLQLRGYEGMLRGAISFSGTPSAGEARVRLSGRYAGEAVDTLMLDAKSRPGVVNVSGICLRVRSAEVTGVATIQTKGVVVGDVGFRDLNPALIPWWKSPEEMPQGLLTGEAHIEAHRAKPVLDATFAVTLAPSRFGRLSIRRGFARIHRPPDGSVAVDSGWVDVPGGRVAITGTLGADRKLDARLSGMLADLKELSPLLQPAEALSGSGRIAAQVTGPLSAPTFTAQGSLFRATLKNGLACDTMTVEAQGTLLPALNLTAEVAGRGLTAGGRRVGNLEARMTGGKTLTISRYRQALGDTVLTLGGVVTFAPEGVRAQLDSLALRAGEHRIKSRGVARVSSVGDHLRIADLLFDLDPGTLQADLDWNPAKQTLDARGRLEGLDLGLISAMQQGRHPITGIARAEFLASGAITDPVLSMRVGVDHPVLGGVAGDSLLLDLDYAPGVLTVSKAEWRAGQSRVKVEGSIRPQVTLDSWWHALGKGDRAWASRAALALSATADGLDLSLIAPTAPKVRTLEGVASASLRVSGTAADPKIDLTGQAPKIGFRGVEGEIVNLSLAYEDRRLRIERLDLRQGGSISQIRGEIPVDLSLYAENRLLESAPLAVSIDVPDGDLSILPVIFPEIASSSGRLAATAQIGGTTRNPKATGTLKIADGKLRWAGRDEILEGVAMEATFDQERLNVTKATARQGKRGRLSLAGWWKWPTAPPPPYEPAAVGPRGEYAFKIKATDFTTTDRETYLFRLTGEFNIVSAKNPDGAPTPWITGHAVISKGELTLDLSRPPGEPGEPLPYLYNISVDIPGNVFYRTLDAEVEVQSDGNLIFKNEGNGDLALGVLNVRGGKYYVVTRQFRNLQGMINFNSPDRIDPEVSITAETTLPAATGTRTVYLSLSDRVSRLKVRVYDDAGTAPDALWKALAIGQFSSTAGLDVSAAGTSTGQEVSGVTLPISNYLFQNVEHWLGGSGFIDTIDLRSGANTPSTSQSGGSPISLVGVGKYVTPDFYLKYSRDFSGAGEEQINADYRVTRFLLL
ncbi:MAG TPA: translocation/assembly module TamB domain-containing protein, partial [Candidatus Eisenbacteria bacterium]|nr:translocation/assembly module TamB domain-containing protein [Candidatus Eisenbacteria bacterium]